MSGLHRGCSALPSRSYYAQRLPVIDVEGVIHFCHDHLRQQLGKSLTGKLRQAYQANTADGPFSIETEAMAGRSHSGMSPSPTWFAAEPTRAMTAVSRFRDADNMTDRIAALQPARRRGRRDIRNTSTFYEQWKH
ncbi:MAG: aminopeptidase N C-terminal domain-containing protein [Geminicoccaceae bacterium]